MLIQQQPQQKACDLESEFHFYLTSNFRVNIIFRMQDLLIAVSHFYDFICTVANRCQLISTDMKKTKTKY